MGNYYFMVEKQDGKKYCLYYIAIILYLFTRSNSPHTDIKIIAFHGIVIFYK